MDLELVGSKCSHRKYMLVLCNAIQYFLGFVCVYLSALQQDLKINILLFLFCGCGQRCSQTGLHSSDCSVVLFFSSQPCCGAQGSCICFNSHICADSSIPLLCCFFLMFQCYRGCLADVFLKVLSLTPLLLPIW